MCQIFKRLFYIFWQPIYSLQAYEAAYCQHVEILRYNMQLTMTLESVDTLLFFETNQIRQTEHINIYMIELEPRLQIFGGYLQDGS